MLVKLSKHQLQAHIRAASQDSARVAFTGHALKQMNRRKISRVMALEVLNTGLLRRPAEPNLAKGSLECRMERFVAGRDLAVVVAVSDDDPDLVVVTAMELKD